MFHGKAVAIEGKGVPHTVENIGKVLEGIPVQCIPIGIEMRRMKNDAITRLINGMRVIFDGSYNELVTNQPVRVGTGHGQ